MNDTPQHPTAPADQRQRDILDEAARILRTTLPPSLTHTPEARAHRDRAALAEVAALAPANLMEAGLAAQYVALMAHAGDCLRQAVQYAADPKIAGKLRAQAVSMERAAQGCRAMLLKVQAVRRKRQADPVTREKDAQTEQYVRRQLTAALERLPAAAAAAPAPNRRDPSPQFDRPLNLRLWEAYFQAGLPARLDRTIH